MPDSTAKKEWMKKNSVMVSVKFMNKSDAALIEYLDAQKQSGKERSAVIKRAIKEYMERHPMEYRYGMRLRGYSPGAQPKGVLRREDDTTGKYHDIIVYDRPLSAEEISNYDLDTITTPAKGEKGQGEK